MFPSAFARVAAVCCALLVAGASSLASDQAIAAQNAAEADTFDRWFTDEAMRVDLLHTGTAREENYGLDEVVVEPLWPGTRHHRIDPFGFGTYRFRVEDQTSGLEIFRQGYSTLFEEWQGTEEAVAGVRRSMSESVRFPMPRKSVVLHIERRHKAGGGFDPLLKLAIDPASHQLTRTRPFESAEVLDLSGGPPPAKAMDVLIVPEGYAASDIDKLRADLQRFGTIFLDAHPWKGNRNRIHVRGLIATSADSGVTEPRKGIFRDTLLGASFNTFDSPRYLTVMQTKRLRQLASRAPYDTLFVMVNTGRYGGGGVYNQWSIFTSDNEYDDYLMLHEFGHHMGGLGDEYYDSAIASDEDALYPRGTEPWEPNLSAFLGSKRDNVKWHRHIAPETPLPTPEQPQFASAVGLFEGAGYKAKGLYRPQLDCKMFHKGLVPFCSVCTHSLESMLRYYSGEEITP